MDMVSSIVTNLFANVKDICQGAENGTLGFLERTSSSQYQIVDEIISIVEK